MTEFSLNLETRPETTKIYRDRGKMLRTLLLAVVFFGGCFLLFWKEAAAGRIAPLKEDMLWFAFAILSIMMPAFVIKMFDGRPALEFSETGLMARDVAADVIPWQAIKAASARSYKRSKFVELQIDPEVLRGLHPNFVQSKLRIFNEDSDFAITSSLHQCSTMMPIFSCSS